MLISPLDKKAAISQRTFYEWKVLYFDLNFTDFVASGSMEISVLVQVMAWAEQATINYLNQCWPNLLTDICCTGVDELSDIEHIKLPQWRLQNMIICI